MSKSSDAVTHTVTDDDQMHAILFSGDGEPHTNEIFVVDKPYKKTTFYGDGTLTLTVALLRSVGLLSPRADLVSASQVFRQPVYVGDTLRVELRQGRQGAGAPAADQQKIDFVTLNQRDDVVLEGSFIVSAAAGKQ